MYAILLHSYDYAFFFYFIIVEFEHVGDMTIFHGQYDDDEVVSRQERHVTTSSFAKWPGGVVPYEISSQFSSK